MTCIGLRTGFDAVAPQWDALIARQDEPNLFLTPAWQRTWWEHFRADADLCVLTVGPESDPLGIAPMSLDGDTLRFLGPTLLRRARRLPGRRAVAHDGPRVRA